MKKLWQWFFKRSAKVKCMYCNQEKLPSEMVAYEGGFVCDAQCEVRYDTGMML